MANGSFSSQLQQKQQTQQGRLTRTQRQVQSDAERKAVARLNSLRAEVERLQKEVFVSKGEVPFTFEDYTQQYQKLSPDVQQYFQSPQAISSENERLKQIEKDTLQTRINLTILKRQETIDKLNKFEADWRTRPNIYRDKNEKYYVERVKYLNDTIDKYQEEISYTQEQSGKIDKGASASDIFDYAINKAETNMRNRDQKAQAVKEFNKQVESGTIDVKWKGNLEGYNKYVETYNKNIEDRKKLQRLSETIGYVNLSPLQQKTVNPSAQEWQQKFPTEVLQFDVKGNVISVQSKQFGGKVFSIADYNALVEKFSAQDTSIQLQIGGEKKQDTRSVMSARIPIIQSQSGGKITIDKFLDWYKNEFVGNIINKKILHKGESYTPEYQIKTEKTTTAPIGMGGRGTVVTTEKFTPETTAEFKNIYTKTTNLEKISNDVFSNYEKKLGNLKVEEINPEKISSLKTDAQKEFESKVTKDFALTDKVYTSEMEKIKREKKWVAEKTPLSLIVTPLRKWNYKQEDYEKKLQGTTKVQTEAEIQAHAERNYQQMIKHKGYPVWLAREVAGTVAFSQGSYYGVKTAIKEHPKTILFKTGLWAGGTATVLVASTYTGGFGGVALSPSLKWALTGAGLLYGGSVVARVSSGTTTYKRGGILGKITAEEIAPMLVGGFAGSYIGAKAISGIDYLYYTKIKKGEYPYRTSYKLTEMKQLRGERFTKLKKGETQQQAFKKLDKGYLTPDERLAIKQATGGRLRVTTHATSVRRAFKDDITSIKAEGREINAMSVANKRMSANFLDIGKSPRYSLYSGQAIPTGSLPLGMRINVQSFGKIPRNLKNFKPSLKLSELEKVLGYKINPKYFKYTSYMYEKGDFGKAYSIGKYGLKSEAEHYLKGFGDLKRTLQQKYYTRIANEKFYQKLTGFRRKGFQEYAFRVEKLSLTKPSTWIDKILGRQTGQFKPMTKGRVVPYERFEALATGDKNLAKQIQKLLASKPRAEVVDILREKQLIQTSKAVSSSSKYSPFTISASYPSSFATQYLLTSRKSKPRSPSVSYSKSYSASLRSAISSVISSPSSPKRSGGGSGSYSGISSGLSSQIYSVISSPIYSPPSAPKQRTYTLPKLQRGDKIKQLLRRKFKPTPEIKGLFPDFTARAVGLEAKQVSLKQALKEIGKLRTGFEIRAGARLQNLRKARAVRGINEKKLMKGVVDF